MGYIKEAKAKKAQADVGRARILEKSEAISPADLELAETALIAANADLEGSKLRLKYTHMLPPSME